MQPIPPQPGPPRPGPVPRRPRANFAAAMIAGILGLLTVAMIVWFALPVAVDAIAGGPAGIGPPTPETFVYVIGSFFFVFLLSVAGGFTFARRIPGAWTLCALCAFFVVGVLAQPLLWGFPWGELFATLFDFGHPSQYIPIGLALIFCVPTAITAAIAGGLKSYKPASTPPPRPGSPPHHPGS